jgi:molybdate transport system substrate-binding protein
VRVAEVAPADTHAPVIYPIAVVKDSRNPSAARAFVGFLTGNSASEVFRRHGFTTVTP